MLGGRGWGRLVVLADFLVQVGMRLDTITQLAPVVFRDFTLGGIQSGQGWVAIASQRFLVLVQVGRSTVIDQIGK